MATITERDDYQFQAIIRRLPCSDQDIRIPS